jgi:hypothetical protein
MTFHRGGVRSLVSLTGLAFSIAATSQTVIVPKEPSNLGRLERELTDYHDCKGNHGCYATDLDREARIATEAVEREVRADGVRGSDPAKLAVVLDIDETSLSNWTEIEQADFAYLPDVWNRWVEQGSAPAIPGTLRFYREAEKLGVAVFFITGRPESQRAATEKNLRGQGYTQWAGLMMKGPQDTDRHIEVFKAAARRKIVEAGYRIAVNMGDQMSDLSGSPRAKVSVKLTDPFYYIP